MKLMHAAVLISAFSMASVAYADETKTTETKTETHTGKKKSGTKTETKTKTDPDGLMNSTTDSSKSEVKHEALDHGKTETTREATVEHDAPGSKNDKKATTKTKVVKDASGNIVEGSKEMKITK
jgi:hypothetical protein